MFSLPAEALRPKPRRANLEALRSTREADAAATKEPALIQEADQLQKRSSGNWKDGSLEDSRRDALMATIKLKHAISLWEQEDAKRRTQTADADKARSDKEFARINKELTAVNDQITLLDKLANAKSSAEKDRLRAEQEKAKLAAAARRPTTKGRRAKPDRCGRARAQDRRYGRGQDLREGRIPGCVRSDRARELELQSGNVSAAATSADLAKEKAEQAAAIAKPEYAKVNESKDRKTQDEALGRDAAALSGVTVKLDRKGDVTRLVLTYGNAFKGKATTITSGKEAVLDGVAALLKKYPSYPMQIIGHTDSKGRPDANLVVSNSRAQAVYNALNQRGIDAKRFVVSGVGGAQPISDNKSAPGRAANNRVEMVFTY